jgi:hypothetical protein
MMQAGVLKQTGQITAVADDLGVSAQMVDKWRAHFVDARRDGWPMIRGRDARRRSPPSRSRTSS